MYLSSIPRLAVNTGSFRNVQYKIVLLTYHFPKLLILLTVSNALKLNFNIADLYSFWSKYSNERSASTAAVQGNIVDSTKQRERSFGHFYLKGSHALFHKFGWSIHSHLDLENNDEQNLPLHKTPWTLFQENSDNTDSLLIIYPGEASIHKRTNATGVLSSQMAEQDKACSRQIYDYCSAQLVTAKLDIRSE